MAFLDSLNIAGSGLTATRLRLDTISQNITNMQTTRTDAGGPYRRKMVVYQPIDAKFSFKDMLNEKINQQVGRGVQVSQIVEDPSDFNPVFNPTHPDANPEGYVMMPNVDPITEMTDMMAATRSYDLILTAANAVKSMAAKALEIGR